MVVDGQPNEGFAFPRCPGFPNPFPRLKSGWTNEESTIGQPGRKDAWWFKPPLMGIFIIIKSNVRKHIPKLQVFGKIMPSKSPPNICYPCQFMEGLGYSSFVPQSWSLLKTLGARSSTAMDPTIRPKHCVLTITNWSYHWNCKHSQCVHMYRDLPRALWLSFFNPKPPHLQGPSHNF